MNNNTTLPSGNITSPAAGIVPYIKDSNNIIHFLLGFENNKWSGFVGGYEDSDENIINTGIREFNEETAGIFENKLKYVRNEINSHSAVLIKGNTRNRKVYLWFVQFPFEIFEESLELLFSINRTKMDNIHFKEKSSIKWFSMDNIIGNSTVLYKLRIVILDNHLRL